MWVAAMLLGCKTEPVPTDSAAPPPTGIRVETVHMPEPCADPEQREVSAFRSQMLADDTPASEVYLWGAGIVAADLDSDGLDELVAVRDGHLEYVAYDPDTKHWVPRSGFPALALDRAFGGAAADVDGDEDLDLYVTRWGEPNHLLINDGNGTFSVSTEAVGPPGHHSAAPTFVDFDLDGDLDLFVAGHGFVDEEAGDPTHFEPADDSLLYLNDGAGAFTLAAGVIPVGAQGAYTFIGAFVDLDGDTDPDLVLVNDFGRRYRSGQLLWNEDGVFVPDDNAAGLDLPVAGMGIAIGELNGDGVPDLLVPFWGGYAFMLSGTDRWFDWSQAATLSPMLSANQTIGWGANFGDLDNDGVLDAVVMHGWLATTITDSEPDQPDGLFRGLQGSFENKSIDWADRDTSDSRGLVVADFDGDGWLDYARPDLSGATRVQMGVCGDGNFLGVELRQSGSNGFAVGAHITAISGDVQHWRRIAAGGEGYGSGGPPRAHFGLGRVDVVDLEIRWPDGVVDTVRDLPAGQRVRITR